MKETYKLKTNTAVHAIEHYVDKEMTNGYKTIVFELSFFLVQPLMTPETLRTIALILEDAGKQSIGFATYVRVLHDAELICVALQENSRHIDI